MIQYIPYHKYDIDIDGGNLRWEIIGYDSSTQYIMLHGISVSPRQQGSGIGTYLMNQLLDIADQLNLPVDLFVAPIGNKIMNEKQLMNWYKQFGFKPTGFSPSHMRYTPDDF